MVNPNSLYRFSEDFEKLCHDPVNLYKWIAGQTNPDGSFTPGIIEQTLLNREYINPSTLMKEYGRKLILPDHAYDLIFQILRKDDLSYGEKKNYLIFRPRGSYKTLCVSIVIYLITVNNPHGTQVMIVTPSDRQGRNMLEYLDYFYQNTPVNHPYWKIINKILIPHFNYKEHMVKFEGVPGNSIKLCLTYTSKVAESLRSAHVPLIIVDECAQVDNEHILTLQGCLNPGGKMVCCTTPGFDGVDWTQIAFVAWIINNETLSENIFSDSDYIRDVILSKKSQVKEGAYKTWTVLRTTIKDVIEKKGRCENELYTWDSIEQLKLDAEAQGQGHVFEADYMLRWPSGAGGQAFPHGLKQNYSDYIPGLYGIGHSPYTDWAMGVDVGLSNCWTVFAVFAKTMIMFDGKLRQIVRLMYLEKMREKEQYKQTDTMKKILQMFPIKHTVIDENGTSGPVYKHIEYLKKELKDEWWVQQNISPGKWSDVNVKINDYSFLGAWMNNQTIFVPNPDYLIHLNTESEAESQFYVNQAKLIKEADGQFLSMIYVPIGKDGRKWTVQKSGKYDDFPDAFAFGLREIINTMDIDSFLKLPETHLVSTINTVGGVRYQEKRSGGFWGINNIQTQESRIQNRKTNRRNVDGF